MINLHGSSTYRGADPRMVSRHDPSLAFTFRERVSLSNRVLGKERRESTVLTASRLSRRCGIYICSWTWPVSPFAPIPNRAKQWISKPVTWKKEVRPTLSESQLEVCCNLRVSPRQASLIAEALPRSQRSPQESRGTLVVAFAAIAVQPAGNC
jgi:hypothetical protein